MDEEGAFNDAGPWTPMSTGNSADQVTSEVGELVGMSKNAMKKAARLVSVRFWSPSARHCERLDEGYHGIAEEDGEDEQHIMFTRFTKVKARQLS